MTARRARWVIVAAVLLVFGRLLACDFTWWDDWVTVHQNEAFRPVTARTFEAIWTTPRASIYVPLTYTVWALVARIAAVRADPLGVAFNPALFHATSLLTHLGGALAAFAVLRRLLRSDPRNATVPRTTDAAARTADSGDDAVPSRAESAARAAAFNASIVPTASVPPGTNSTAFDPTIVPALLGALVWAVHPVQVESVGWVSGLKDVLGGTLALCTILLYARWRQAGGRAVYAALAGVYVLAMLAKPSAFTTPLLLVVLDRLVFNVPWRRIVVAMTPLAVLTAPVALVARLAQPAVAADAPLWARPLMAGDALAFYLLKTVLPLELTFDYGRNYLWLRTSWQLYAAWLLPAAVAGVAAWAYRRAKRTGRPLSPLPAVGGLIFALAPLHVLGLTRFEFQVISGVADHYLYVAVFGAGVAAAWAAARWPRYAGAMAVGVAALAARAAWQTPVWQDETTLMTHATRVNPQSWTAYTNLAAMAFKTRDFDAEARYLARAEALRPDDAIVVLGRVSMCVNRGEIGQAHAYARKLIGIYDTVFRTPKSGAGQPYHKIMDRFIDAGYLDDGQRYWDELARIDPKDPALPRYAERIRRRREAADRPAG